MGIYSMSVKDVGLSNKSYGELFRGTSDTAL